VSAAVRETEVKRGSMGSPHRGQRGVSVMSGR